MSVRGFWPDFPGFTHPSFLLHAPNAVKSQRRYEQPPEKKGPESHAKPKEQRLKRRKRRELSDRDDGNRCGGTAEAKESSKNNGEQTFPRLDGEFIYLGRSSAWIQPLQKKKKTSKGMCLIALKNNEREKKRHICELHPGSILLTQTLFWQPVRCQNSILLTVSDVFSAFR